MFINFLVVVAALSISSFVTSARRLSETFSFVACGTESAKCAKKTSNKEMRSHKGTNLEWFCVLFSFFFRVFGSFAFVLLGWLCMCEYV